MHPRLNQDAHACRGAALRCGHRGGGICCPTRAAGSAASSGQLALLLQVMLLKEGCLGGAVGVALLELCEARGPVRHVDAHGPRAALLGQGGALARAPLGGGPPPEPPAAASAAPANGARCNGRLWLRSSA
eukprot:6409897-Pyramimonas_sp.AAC.1